MGSRRNFIRFIWWLYIVLLFLLVAVKFNGSLVALKERIASGQSSVNLVPLKTLRLQWRYFSSSWGRRNMLGNFLPFIPLGLLTPSAFPQLSVPRRFFLFALSLVLGIELFQLVSRLGSFDVDDILLNMLGAAAGYLLAAPEKKTLP